ncbi:AMP-binding protein [Pendulispora rubella]|uniref:AMP-binding protein n=1 Tax=Pendulispora rubella TaxID=2741070 RepID=A0ABZ2KY42_9BACT
MSLSILDAARETPDRIGLVIDGASYSYAALAERTRAALGWLHAKGISRDASLALVGTLRLETIVLLYALLEQGTPAVLVHPRLTGPERASLLEDARATLFVEDAAAEAWSAADPVLARGADAIEAHRTLAILYTSGTSGRAKGAMLSRGAFLAAARASERNLGWQPDDRWLLCMPLAHVGGLSIVVRSLLARSCVVVQAGFEPEAIARVIERDRVTLVSFVPTMLKKMLDRGWPCPPHLRAILLGGAPASESLLEASKARGLPVLTTYGLTEACSQVTTQQRGTEPSFACGAGEPLEGAEVRIDGGEILVRGPMLMSGYFPKDAHPDPFLPGGWFRTGDLGTMDAQGRLHVLARRGDLIITGGENVYPVEVESALERIEGIREACVFSLPDETWGAIVVAALVAVDAQLTDAELSSRFQERLAPHKRPRRIAWLSGLARGAQDKLDRSRTAALATPRLQPLRKE